MATPKSNYSGLTAPLSHNDIFHDGQDSFMLVKAANGHHPAEYELMVPTEHNGPPASKCAATIYEDVAPSASNIDYGLDFLLQARKKPLSAAANEYIFGGLAENKCTSLSSCPAHCFSSK